MAADIATVKPFSEATFSTLSRIGPLVVSGGIVALDADGNVAVGSVREQAGAVFQRLEELLRQLNCELRDVVKVTGYLADLADFDEYADVWDKVFFEIGAPSRTTLGARLPDGVKVKIEAIAWSN